MRDLYFVWEELLAQNSDTAELRFVPKIKKSDAPAQFGPTHRDNLASVINN